MQWSLAASSGAPLLVLAHGAGAGSGHPWMRGVASGLTARGVSVVTFDFPYTAAGRRRPDPATVLEKAFEAVWHEVSANVPPLTRLFAGGKSMGGRIASQVTARAGFTPAPVGLVFFGYPLHPPATPAVRRDRHLPGISVPMLFVHGTRDPFGSPDEMTALTARLAGANLHLVDGGNHSLEVPKRTDPDGAAVGRAVDAAAAWMLDGRAAGADPIVPI